MPSVLYIGLRVWRRRGGDDVRIIDIYAPGLEVPRTVVFEFRGCIYTKPQGKFLWIFKHQEEV